MHMILMPYYLIYTEMGKTVTAGMLIMKKNWGKIIKYCNKNMQLAFKNFQDTPLGPSYPSLLNQTQINDINRRNTYRILQMNTNARQ